MLRRFADFIKEQHLVARGDKVLLGVSGGRDSVAMAHLFHRAAIPFGIAHCHFGLRPVEADRDEAFVHRLAEAYGVPLHVAHFPTLDYARAHSLSVEAAARTLRYAFFATLCRSEGYASVAVAHHRDDSVETLLLNLTRATGLGGLHGIRPRSLLPEGCTVVRPMLGFSRADIDAYVAEQQLDYVDDSTNASTDIRRNYVRHRLLPLLRDFAPSFDEVMQANIERFYQSELLFRHGLRRTFAQWRERGLLAEGDFGLRLALPLPEADCPAEALPTLLFELLHPYGFNSAQVSRLAASLGSVGAEFVADGHRLVVGRRSLVVEPLPCASAPIVADASFALEPLPLAQLPQVLQQLRSDAEFRAAHAVVDAQHLRLPLALRRWQKADRFQPFGMKGSRLVSDYLKDLKLDPLDKARALVLTDADGRIVWLVGHRTDQRFAVDPSSPTAQPLLVSLAQAPSALAE